MKEEKKEIEVITGDSSDLNISPVYDHLEIEKPKKEKEEKEIVVPQEKKNK